MAKNKQIRTVKGAGGGEGTKTVKPRAEEAKATQGSAGQRDGCASTGTSTANARCGQPRPRHRTYRAEVRMAQPRKSPNTVSIGASADARSAEAAKTARLRALRLAKEAQDRAAASSTPAAPARHAPARLRRSPRAGGSVPRNGPAD